LAGITLLEKLYEYEKNPQQRGSWDTAKIQESVLNQLNRILNSKQKTALAAPDFGMPDFTNMPGSFSLETYSDFESTIKGVIEKYEPRLKNVNVSHAKDENSFLSLKFKVEGRIILEYSSIEISLETVIDPEGKININA